MQLTWGGGTDIAIEVSEVKWYFVKGQEPQPTLTFDKNNGTGENPTVTFGEANEAGMFTVTLPENTFTAPANKYFRGWEYNEVVYFPDEQFDIKAGATATFKAVWEEFAVTQEEDITAKILKWATDGSSYTKVLLEGQELKLVTTVTGVTAGYHGILLSAAANSDTYRFRPDSAFFTQNGGDSWANTSHASVPHVEIDRDQWNETSYLDLYKDGGSAIQVATATLSGNVLTYVFECFASSDTQLSSPIVKSTYRLTSTSNIREILLTIHCDTATHSNAKISCHWNLSTNQSPTTENPIAIGSANNDLAYTGLAPVWTSILKKGEKVVLHGTMTSTGTQNYHAPIMYLFNDSVPCFNIRTDNFVNGNTSNNQWPMTVSNGWTITSDEGNKLSNPVGSDWWGGVRQILTKANLEITFDYTAENIVIKIQATGTAENENKDHTYVCTFTASGTFDDVMYIGLGGEACYVNITSLTRTGAASTKA